MQRSLTVVRCCARVMQQPTHAGKDGIKGTMAPSMHRSIRSDENTGGTTCTRCHMSQQITLNGRAGETEAARLHHHEKAVAAVKSYSGSAEITEQAGDATACESDSSASSTTSCNAWLSAAGVILWTLLSVTLQWYHSESSSYASQLRGQVTCNFC